MERPSSLLGQQVSSSRRPPGWRLDHVRGLKSRAGWTDDTLADLNPGRGQARLEAHMRKRVINRKLAVAVIAAVCAAVGLVYAQWTTNGSGSAYAKAGTAQALSTVDV